MESDFEITSGSSLDGIIVLIPKQRHSPMIDTANPPVPFSHYNHDYIFCKDINDRHSLWRWNTDTNEWKWIAYASNETLPVKTIVRSGQKLIKASSTSKLNLNLGGGFRKSFTGGKLKTTDNSN